MRGAVHPNSYNYWGEAIRSRISEQVPLIKHWEVREGSYEELPDVAATWFVDPPYQRSGKIYPFGSKLLDYPKLGLWCLGRKGQTVVCEQEGADWLPFRPFMKTKAVEGRRGSRVSNEVIYVQEK